MNPIKKAYCRIFQKAFHIAIPLLPYRTPKILGHVVQIPDLLKEQKISHVLIVTDESIKAHGLTIPLEEALQKNEIAYSIYDKTVANPTTQNVEEAKDLYLEQGAQAIIGIGGGSSIDCAKIVGARIAKPKQSIEKMEGILKIRKKIPLFIAVPTTAGTGSETTLAAVITDGKTRHKFPINDFSLIPSYAVLDPAMTKTLPKSLTATTGMDALTHAVEAYIGRSTTIGTRKNAIRATKLIFENLEKAYENGNDEKARANMLKAAFYAGAAFTKSYVGYCHAVAHSLGGKYNTPHGFANAVLLPITLEMYGEAAYKKLKKLAVATGLCQRDEAPEKAAELFIQKIRLMNQHMDIPQTISGIVEKDIPKLAHYADKEANPLYPVPVLMNAKELEQMYYLVKGE